MKIFASSFVMLASLAATGVHAADTLVVQDNVLDAATAAEVYAQLPTASRFREVVDLPGKLYERLLAVMQPGAAAPVVNTQVPVRGDHGPVRGHKDLHADGSVADAQVGLLYLEGDGQMKFTHEATGKETVVDVQPGRFLSWDNAAYTHELLPGSAPRLMVGPMAFKDSVMQSVGGMDGIPVDGFFFTDSFIGQVHVKSLLVKPGGWVHVILDFLVTDWPPLPIDGDGRRKTRQLDGSPPAPTDLTIYAGTSPLLLQAADNNKDSWTQDEVEFKAATLKPNTWGKVKPEVDEVGDGAQLTLLEDDVVSDKQYKATWKFHVGKEIPSGTEISFFVQVEGTNWSDEVVVTVK